MKMNMSPLTQKLPQFLVFKKLLILLPTPLPDQGDRSLPSVNCNDAIASQLSQATATLDPGHNSNHQKDKICKFSLLNKKLYLSNSLTCILIIDLLQGQMN